MSRRTAIGVLTTFLILASVWVGIRAWRSRLPMLPYTDSFAQRHVSEWTPFGGSWRLDGDTISVTANESDAKLTIGSERWSNYQMWTDVELLGHIGTIGVAVRASDDSLNKEAVHGYLITLRSADAGLEISRATRSTLSTEPSRLVGGVRAKVWYRLHVVAVGCGIAAEATNIATGKMTYAGFQDSDSLCMKRGAVVLRTTATAAAWKHVRIADATVSDLDAIKAHLTDVRLPAYPILERDYSAMREAYLAHIAPDEINRPTNLGGFGPVAQIDSAELVGIGDLRSQLWNPEPVRIVGVITAASPLYLQDAASGIQLAEVPGVVSRPGDEVEVLGSPFLNGSVLWFKPVAGRFLSDRVSVSPLSVTATQAATGRYEGSLIELNGTVRSSTTMPDGDLGLLLEDGAQRFTVRIPYDLFAAASPQFEVNSRVQVRGVCSMDRSNEQHRGTFVLHATSSSDITLLEGPPWWTGQRLIWLICGGFLLVGSGVALYGMEERTKLRIVQQERERISHEMHDTLAQSLAGVGFRLQGIHRSLRASGVVPQSYVDDLKMTCELVANTHREASSNIAAMHPASQQDADVLMMLEKAVYSMLDDEDFPVIVASHGTPRTLSPVVSDTLYRVGREAIANALRHAQASSIKVQLSYRSRHVLLSVVDDGVGFVFNPLKPGFGTKSMMTRCDAIKAKFSITSTAEGGCRVQVISPYRVRRGWLRWVG